MGGIITKIKNVKSLLDQGEEKTPEDAISTIVLSQGSMEDGGNDDGQQHAAAEAALSQNSPEKTASQDKDDEAGDTKELTRLKEKSENSLSSAAESAKKEIGSDQSFQGSMFNPSQSGDNETESQFDVSPKVFGLGVDYEHDKRYIRWGKSYESSDKVFIDSQNKPQYAEPIDRFYERCGFNMNIAMVSLYKGMTTASVLSLSPQSRVRQVPIAEIEADLVREYITSFLVGSVPPKKTTASKKHEIAVPDRKRKRPQKEIDNHEKTTADENDAKAGEEPTKIKKKC